MSDVVPVRCSILRGGTSKAVFFIENDIPAGRAERERMLLDVFGSPDVRQIDGLGGATSQTSKAALIGPSTRPDADIDYTFAQVVVTDSVVDWGGNCGNISSAVGPFAINAGFVRAVEPITTVRIHNTNTAKVIVAHVPVEGGRARTLGDHAIPGVPGTAARILMEFEDPAGSSTGKLLPTGRTIDTLELADGRSFQVSIVDAANPVVFFRASDLGVDGTETWQEIEANEDLCSVLEEGRSIVCEWLGIVDDRANATKVSPGLPKVGYVAPPAAYTNSVGEHVPADAIDLNGRLMSVQTAHRSYMTTGAIATAAAAVIPGTIVHEVTRSRETRPEANGIRIAHPYGVMGTVVRADESGELPQIHGISVGRTARHILDGTVWVRKTALGG
jgi:methylitaconate Delta-isomerase